MQVNDLTYQNKINTDEGIFPFRNSANYGHKFNCGNCKNIVMQQDSLKNWKHLKPLENI